MTIRLTRVDEAACERIIANAMVGVATELRLADASELIRMIRCDQAANIADLVNSSAELFFKEGTLRYALSAGCRVEWDSTPLVEFDMEFRHAAVSVFFRLTIGERRAGVKIVDAWFDERDLDEAEKSRQLATAVAAARIGAQ